MRSRACQHLSRREVASALGISYSSARYCLERLARLDLITKHVAWPPYRVFYHVYPPAPPPPPPPPPPVIEEYIGDEEPTGLDIYYNTDEKKYKVREPDIIHFRADYPPHRTSETLKIPDQIKDTEARKLIRLGYAEFKLVRTEDEIVIELTGSVETFEDHDVPCTLEITAITTVKEKDASEITRITRREGPMEEGLISWLVINAWGELARRLDTIDFAFIGKSIEKKRGYPCVAPNYKKCAVWMERRSRYVARRRYPSVGCDEFEAVE